jgi:outer membrane protein insertion porin family
MRYCAAKCASSKASWFSQLALDRSRLRIQRLGFFDNVNIETIPVEGTDDQVDIVVNVEEQPSGSFQIGLGYSQFQGIIASFVVEQDNFLGSGRQVGFSSPRSRFLTQAGVSYTNPYWTDDGVSRGFFLRYSEFDTVGRSSNIRGLLDQPGCRRCQYRLPGDRSRLPPLWCIGPARRSEPPGRHPVRRHPRPGCAVRSGSSEIPADRPLGIALDQDGDGFLSRSERRLTTYRAGRDLVARQPQSFPQPDPRLAQPGQLPKWPCPAARASSTSSATASASTGRSASAWRFPSRGDISYGDAIDNYDAAWAWNRRAGAPGRPVSAR